MTLALALAALLALGAGSASANTLFYVSPSGSNVGNCQSAASPCKTLTYTVGQTHAVMGDLATIQAAASSYYRTSRGAARCDPHGRDFRVA